MKIAFTGTHGCGKSSVARVLKEKLPDYYFEQSATRLAVTTKQANFGTTSESQQAIINVEFGLFLNAPKDYVSERHSVDRLAYSHYFMDRNGIGPNALERARDCLRMVMERKVFDLVFYVPIEFVLVQKGPYREGQDDLTYQAAIDEHILRYLAEYQIPYITITGRTPEERADKVMTYVDEYELLHENEEVLELDK